MRDARGVLKTVFAWLRKRHEKTLVALNIMLGFEDLHFTCNKRGDASDTTVYNWILEFSIRCVFYTRTWNKINCFAYYNRF